MGSSYRSDLNLGGVQDWQDDLREACRLIQRVREDIWGIIGSDGQYDNAADDGALAEKLGLAKRLIEDELPGRSPEGASS